MNGSSRRTNALVMGNNVGASRKLWLSYQRSLWIVGAAIAIVLCFDPAIRGQERGLPEHRKDAGPGGPTGQLNSRRSLQGSVLTDLDMVGQEAESVLLDKGTLRSQQEKVSWGPQCASVTRIGLLGADKAAVRQAQPEQAFQPIPQDQRCWHDPVLCRI